jgi:protein-histidine pros-kinase
MRYDAKHAPMKLASKFNAILGATLAAGSLTAFLIARQYLLTNARDQVLQQARLMMETSTSTRKYTSENIRPILDRYQRRSAVFYPESVPAFSASRMFSYLREKYPEYSYREATLNPTNPSDRAVDWEADIIHMFRNTPGQLEFIGDRESPSGRVLYLARPIKAVESCLECHSIAKTAPKAMLAVYGADNGFGWKLNEIIGAQIVSVPLSVPQALASRTLWRFLILIAAFSIVTLILFNLALSRYVIRPVDRLSLAADEFSKGNFGVAELPVTGNDEISVLTRAFNRMHRSLAKAANLFER